MRIIKVENDSTPFGIKDEFVMHEHREIDSGETLFESVFYRLEKQWKSVYVVITHMTEKSDGQLQCVQKHEYYFYEVDNNKIVSTRIYFPNNLFLISVIQHKDTFFLSCVIYSIYK